MSVGTILLIILILILIGALPTWGHSRGWGYGPSGILGVIVIVIWCSCLWDEFSRSGVMQDTPQKHVPNLVAVLGVYAVRSPVGPRPRITFSSSSIRSRCEWQSPAPCGACAR